MGKNKSKTVITDGNGKRVTIKGNGSIFTAGRRIVTDDGTVIENRVGKGGYVIASDGDLEVTFED